MMKSLGYHPKNVGNVSVNHGEAGECFLEIQEWAFAHLTSDKEIF